MEFDVESTPSKTWLVRKTAQAHLNNGRPKQALRFADQGLKLKPDDESLKNIKFEAEKDLESQK